MSAETQRTPHVAEHTRLPSIPSLPPIRMPSPTNSSDLTSMTTFNDTNYNDNPVTSTTSYTSEDSFTTAHSSSPLSAAPDQRHPYHIDSSLSTPRMLAKSVSVDSFIKYKQASREPLLPKQSTAQNTGRDSTIDPDLMLSTQESLRHPYQLPARVPPRGNVQHGLGRSRGGSLVPSENDVYDPSSDESDLERWRRTPRPIGESSQSVSRTKRAKVSPSDLSMPSRSAESFGSPSRPALNRSPSTTDRMRHTHATRSPSMSSPQSTINVTKSIVEQRSPPKDDEARLVPPNTGRRGKRERGISINTTSSKEKKDQEMYTIGVIGARGCGKTTFIRKCLKYHGVPEPDQSDVIVPSDGGQVTLRYTTYTARIKRGLVYIVVKVIEVDVAVLDLGNTAPSRTAWPFNLPQVDGILICYDASEPQSFEPVPGLLREYDVLRLPTIVLACKSELDKRVFPKEALDRVAPYAGIIELSHRTPSGKTKIQKCLDIFIISIDKGKAANKTGESSVYRNPASPQAITRNANPPWNSAPAPSTTSEVSAPSGSNNASQYDVSEQTPSNAAFPTTPTMSTPTAATTPVRARSTGDLLSEHQKSVAKQDRGMEVTKSRSNTELARLPDKNGEAMQPSPGEHGGVPFEEEVIVQERTKDHRPAPWATLEELLDKLFFLAVTGDDPTFVGRFFLTYRRFATPRSILLGMQKRMIELSNISNDFMLASFAQMRICNLLENWIREYRSDFAVPGTYGALNALIKQILSHTHTLHYGSDLIPFLELVPTLVDQDAAWAIKPEPLSSESDESDSLYDGSYDSEHTPVQLPPLDSDPHAAPSSNGSPLSTRARKPSISAKGILQSSLAGVTRIPRHSPGTKASPKEICARLAKVAQQVLATDSAAIGDEITRIEYGLLMCIQDRHWLRHALVPGKKDPEVDPIARFNSFYNHMHDWVASLILCHDKPKWRARLMEKFAEVANRLRTHNNYSALRAVITGINSCSFPGEPSMELFKMKSDIYKKFRSWEIIFQSTRSHQSYRMALRNSKGPCIPSLEIHLSDLLRTHEGNPDFHKEDPKKIHWGKFNLLGKCIGETRRCQTQCTEVSGYNLPENLYIGELLRVQTMDAELQEVRVGPPPEDVYDAPLQHPITQDLAYQTRDGSTSIRRLFFWQQE